VNTQTLNGLDLIKERSGSTVTHQIALDPADAATLERLSTEAIAAKAATISLDPDSQGYGEVAAYADQAQAAAEEFLASMDVITFHIQAIDRLLWEAMVIACQPTEEQTASFKQFTGNPDAVLDVDRRRFLPLAIEACVTKVTFSNGATPIEPETEGGNLSQEAVAALTNEDFIGWPDQDLLREAIVVANQRGTAVKRLGKG